MKKQINFIIRISRITEKTIQVYTKLCRFCYAIFALDEFKLFKVARVVEIASFDPPKKAQIQIIAREILIYVLYHIFRF